MGTRGLILVKLNDEYKVAQYGQYDNYPKGEGWKVVRFLKNYDLEIFKNKISNLEEWKQDDVKEVYDKEYISIYYPELDSRTSSDILSLIYKDKVKKINKHLIFAKNSLFCEWAWCVNLDTKTLDCFKGFQVKPLDEEQPFYEYQLTMNENDKYYPIKLICSIPFDNLKEFDTDDDFDYYITEKIEPIVFDNGIPKNWDKEI